MKKSFLLYADFEATLNKLPDEIAGKVFKEIFQYFNTGQRYSGEDLLIEVVLTPLYEQLDRNAEKWETTKGGRSFAGKESARIKAERKEAERLIQQNSTNSTNVESVQQSSTKSTVNVSVSVSDSVNEKKDIDIATKKLKTFKSWNQEDLKEAIRPNVEQYTKETCNDFYNHWREPLPSGKPRMTLEKAWDTKKRLATWKRNESKFGAKSGKVVQIEENQSRAMRGVKL